MKRPYRPYILTMCACLAVWSATVVLPGSGSSNLHKGTWQLELKEAAASRDLHFDLQNILGLCVAFLVASMAASAGVGGGAFFVPLAMVCLRFSLKEATVLSQACITAVSAASIAFNINKRHPSQPATKTLIGYETLLTFTPPLLLGVSLGVLFNAVLPTWLITTLLICMLGFMSTRTMQKGLKQWSIETDLRQRQAAAAAAAVQSPDPPVQSVAAAEASGPCDSPSLAVVVITEEAQPSGVKEQRAPYPWLMLCGVLFLWIGFSGLQLLRQMTERCSISYFAVCGLQVLFGIGCSLLFAYYCVARPARQQAAAQDLQQPLLTHSSALQTVQQQHMQHQQSMWCLTLTACKVALAGVVAGILGIGGGMIMAPMLLESGVHPLSASATSNVLVFMCSSSATLAFLLDGRVNAAYSEVYCVVCGAASLVGLTVMGGLVARSGRPSIVVLLLAFIMGSGALCSGVFGYLDAWHQAQEGAAGFKNLCKQ